MIGFIWCMHSHAGAHIDTNDTAVSVLLCNVQSILCSTAHLHTV